MAPQPVSARLHHRIRRGPAGLGEHLQDHDSIDVPTLAESPYAGLEVLSWYGILAPARTPQDIVRKLNADINRILQAPDVRERLTALGTEPTGGTPEKFAETIKADTARWAKVVADANIRID